MSVFKEGWFIIQSLGSQQRRVYQDAADFGVPITKGDGNWKQLKQLMEWYGDEGTRHEERYMTGVTVVQQVTLMDEGTGRKTRFSVAWVTDRSKATKFNGYATVTQLR